jgi:negative regulator of sigma E activity
MIAIKTSTQEEEKVIKKLTTTVMEFMERMNKESQEKLNYVETHIKEELSSLETLLVLTLEFQNNTLTQLVTLQTLSNTFMVY